MSTCEWCKNEFEPKSEGQIYCKPLHGKRARNARASERRELEKLVLPRGTGLCPTPYKKGFNSLEHAKTDEYQAIRNSVYKCTCGQFHYTSRTGWRGTNTKKEHERV